MRFPTRRRSLQDCKMGIQRFRLTVRVERQGRKGMPKAKVEVRRAARIQAGISRKVTIACLKVAAEREGNASSLLIRRP